MARPKVNRTINPKALANVRDAASRRDFDRNWAINAVPKFNLDDIDLLHRYVAALLLYKAPCPKTEEEIDEIGIFKNYAHKFIDEGTGTLEDIQELYAKQDRLGDRPRFGTARGIKSWKKADNVPSDDFDNDNTTDIEPEPVSGTEDYPAYDEVETDSNDITDYTPIKDITNIEELNREDFDNPMMNTSFNSFNDEHIILNGPKIGFTVTISSEDESESRNTEIWGKSFGDALNKLLIISEALLSEMSYTIDYSKVINAFKKRYSCTLDEKSRDEYYNKADELRDRLSSINQIIRVIENL